VSDKIKRKKKFQPTEILFSGSTNRTGCAYYDGSHYSDRGRFVTDINRRKEMLKRDVSNAPDQDTYRKIIEEAEPSSNVKVRIMQVYAKKTRVVTDKMHVSRTRKMMSKIQRRYPLQSTTRMFLYKPLESTCALKKSQTQFPVW